MAGAVAAALKGEPDEGAVILAAAGTRVQAHSVPYNPLGVFQPGSPENEEWTHETIRRLQDLGRVFQLKRRSPEGEDSDRSPEAGVDPVKPVFKPNKAHEPGDQDFNPAKDPEPPGL